VCYWHSGRYTGDGVQVRACGWVGVCVTGTVDETQAVYRCVCCVLCFIGTVGMTQAVSRCMCVLCACLYLCVSVCVFNWHGGHDTGDQALFLSDTLSKYALCICIRHTQ